MTVESKFASARALIEQFNLSINGGDSASKSSNDLDAEKFLSNLRLTGAGLSEETLKDLSYEDILECFFIPTGNPKPVILAKNLAKIFRGKDEVVVEASDKRPGVGSKKADKMTPKELIEALDPEEENAVFRRLRDMSRGQRFVVFVSGRTVDVETTLKLLLEAKQGYAGREIIEVNGKPKKVYLLGELPNNYAEENPLYPNRPLRPDGTCDQTLRSWEGIPMNVRQLVYLAVKSGEIKVTLENAHNTLDKAIDENAFATLSLRYPKAAMNFTEHEDNGTLPKLKIALGEPEGKLGVAQARPFDDGKKIMWIANMNSNSYSAVDPMWVKKGNVMPKKWK